MLNDINTRLTVGPYLNKTPERSELNVVVFYC